MVLCEEPVPLLDHLPQIDPDLAEIVGKAMSRDVSKRYQSAARMRSDLLPFTKRSGPQE